jgi:hypothetical protein
MYSEEWNSEVDSEEILQQSLARTFLGSPAFAFVVTLEPAVQTSATRREEHRNPYSFLLEGQWLCHPLVLEIQYAICLNMECVINV